MIYATPKQMKTIEAAAVEAGISYLELMENAGSKVTEFILNLMSYADFSGGIVILAGGGNNGGDGFVIARNLADAGKAVAVIIADKEPSTDLSAYEYCELSGHSGVTVLNLNDNIETIFSLFSSAGIIVDAVFGTGFHGELPPSVKACFSFVSRCPAKKLAVDVPSGGNCLSGEVADGTIKADFTVTLACKKTGMELYPLKEYCGQIYTEDIGIPEECFSSVGCLLEDADFSAVKALIPKRKSDSHKGSFGKLLNISGSRCMSGAAALSTLAALRSGAGIVKLASTETVINRLASSIFEAVYLPLKETCDGSISADNSDILDKEIKNYSAVSIGCGLSCTADTKKITENILTRAECPIILDADGINCIAGNIDIIKNTKNKLIITPHAGELGRLLGISAKEAAADRLSAAVKLSSIYKIVVVAKGVPTFVVGDGKAYLCRTGNPGLSRGGSGDVLTGIIAGFVTQGIPPIEAALAGVLVHGHSADRLKDKTSMLGMLPTDVINELPYVFGELNI